MSQFVTTSQLTPSGIPWSIWNNGGGTINIPAFTTRASDLVAVNQTAPTREAIGWNLTTNGGTNSSCLFSPNSSGFLRFGNNLSGSALDFSLPIWFCYRGSAFLQTAQTTIRMQLGGFANNSTTVGDFPAVASNLQGMGFLITNGKVFIETATDVTGSMQRFQTDTGLTYGVNVCCPFFNFKLYSSGTGKIILYSDNNIVFEKDNIGPVGPNTNIGNRVAFSVSSTSGVTEFNSGFNITDGNIAILVEQPI